MKVSNQLECCIFETVVQGCYRKIERRSRPTMLVKSRIIRSFTEQLWTQIRPSSNFAVEVRGEL